MRRGRDLATACPALAIVGTALPLGRFVPWLAEHGLDPAAFVAELFATRIGGFFGWDVIISAVVTILSVAVQGGRDRVAHRWLPIVATLLVGISCGLPLFLALRERAARSVAA